MKGGRVLRTMGIKEGGGESVSNVTRIITLLNGDFTVKGPVTQNVTGCNYFCKNL